MTVRYSVDLDELAEKIREMAAFERDVERALDHLERVITRLDVSWTGAAATAQREAHERWATGMREMQRGLKEIRDAAERAHTNYSNAVAANQRMWASVR